VSELNSRPTPDTLEDATGALREAPVPPGPPPELVAATVALIHNRLAGAVPAEQVRRERRRRIMRYASFTTAAAVILGTAGVLWFGGTSAAAFQKAIEKARRAESVGYTQRLAVEGIPEQVEIARIRGDQFRIEDGDGTRTRIANLRTRKAVFLDADRKLAQFVDLPVGQETPPGLLESLNKLAGQDGEKVGDEDVAGTRATKFRLKRDEPKGGAEEWFVWIDPKTGWPVKMQNTGKVALTQENGQEKMVPYTLTLDKFEWNAKFEDKLFSLDAPTGYKSVKGIAPPVIESGRTVFVNFVLPALENAEKAKSVQILATAENNGKATFSRTVYRQGDSIRVETARGAERRDETVVIADLKTREALLLDPKAKTARRTTLGSQEMKLVAGVMEGLSGIKEQVAGGDEKALKDLGEEKLGDRTTRAYEIRREDEVWKVWIDPKTSLPVRIQVGEQGKSTLTLDFSKWTEEFDGMLFELKVPEGYKVIEEPKKK
jgi:outer membrane lipoprotein-sorting protein